MPASGWSIQENEWEYKITRIVRNEGKGRCCHGYSLRILCLFHRWWRGQRILLRCLYGWRRCGTPRHEPLQKLSLLPIRRRIRCCTKADMICFYGIDIILSLTLLFFTNCTWISTIIRHSVYYNTQFFFLSIIYAQFWENHSIISCDNSLLIYPMKYSIIKPWFRRFQTKGKGQSKGFLTITTNIWFYFV